MTSETLSREAFDALLAEQGLDIPQADRQAALDAARKLREAADRVAAAASRPSEDTDD